MNTDEPISNPTPTDDPAVGLIRGKVSDLYANEPDLKEEENEIEALGAHSKHQLYMQRLMQSGQSFVDMQNAWHAYYQSLADSEKHEVWQEFYSNQSRNSHFLGTNAGLMSEEREKTPEKKESKTTTARKSATKKVKEVVVAQKKSIQSMQSVADVKKKIAATVSADGRLETKHHLKSLFFGFSLSGIFAIIIIFALFNQIFLAPFITPSKQASASPLIADVNGNAIVTPESRIIIPKINVDAPLVIDAPDNQEKSIQKALERGVTLYPKTGVPGELGNPTMFGHSSNNLFNKGNYKFVFVLLSKLEVSDTFMINYNSKQYTYKVFEKKIVKPSDVAVLNEHPKTAMVTLITCDPPGTSTNRLIIHAEQISPDPAANATSAIAPEAANTNTIPGNAESLFQRLLHLL